MVSKMLNTLCYLYWLIVSKKELENAAYANTVLMVNYVCENEEWSMNCQYTCVSGGAVQLLRSFNHLGPEVLIKQYKNWVSTC